MFKIPKEQKKDDRETSNPLDPTEISLTGSTILIIDDSETERSTIRNILEKVGIFSEIYEASDGLEGFKILLEKRPDIVLCDMVMPQYDGMSFLKMRRVSRDPSIQTTPVLMLTGINRLAMKVRGFEMGASDYIVKPIEPLELVARVKVHLKLRRAQEQLIAQKEQLERQNQLLRHLSATDPLTGVHNRRYLLERLEESFMGALRYRYSLGIIMFDLDHFKQINDTYGHQAGDYVLRRFTEITVGELRKSDFMGRYGGEEFLVALPYTNLKGTYKTGERIRRLIQNHDFIVNGEKFHVTVSGGVAAFPEVMCATPWDLIRAADSALYEAKRKGRNRVIVYEGEIHEGAPKSAH